VDLIYLAALFQLHRFVLNGRMTATVELHRQWSWPNLKKCPSSSQEQLRKAWKISSHDSRLIRKVAAQSSSYYHCDASCCGHDHCQFGSIVQSGCMTSIGTLGCFAHRGKSAEAWRWLLTSVPLRCKLCWVCFGKKQQFVFSCRSAFEGKCPSSCTEWFWTVYFPPSTVITPATFSQYALCYNLSHLISDRPQIKNFQ
jgi:hypothetical protein